MQPLESLRFEGCRLGRGVVAEDGGLVHVSLDEANAAAVLEVDGGKKDHGRHLRKLAMSLRPEILALLGVELGPGHVAPRHHRGDRSAIGAYGGDIGRIARLQGVGVHEIGMQAVRAHLDAFEQRMIALWMKVVPAHMRDLQGRIVRLDRLDLAGDPVEAEACLVFEASRRKKLHADADAKDRASSTTHRFGERIHHSLDRAESAPAIRERTDTGKHDTIRAAHHIRIGGDLDRLGKARFAGRALERLCRRMEISRAVVDDGNAHRGRSASGKRPITGSALRRRPSGAAGATGAPRPATVCESQRAKVLEAASSES